MTTSGLPARFYTGASNWPMGATQVAILKALATADPEFSANPTGRVDRTGYNGMSQSDISKLSAVLGTITVPTLREAIFRLVERSLVERVQLGKRAVAYRLTPSGRAVAREVVK